MLLCRLFTREMVSRACGFESPGWSWKQDLLSVSSLPLPWKDCENNPSRMAASQTVNTSAAGVATPRRDNMVSERACVVISSTSPHRCIRHTADLETRRKLSPLIQSYGHPLKPAASRLTTEWKVVCGAKTGLDLLETHDRPVDTPFVWLSVMSPGDF